MTQILTEEEFLVKYPYGSYGGYLAMMNEREFIAKYGRTIPNTDNDGFLEVAKDNELKGASND
jgi:hypothetical protein